MYKNLSKKLKKVNPGTLTERYLEELKKELILKRLKERIHNKVGKIVKKNIDTAINLANNVQLDFFMQINEQYSLNMKRYFFEYVF